jgi:hypothetical protein
MPEESSEPTSVFSKFIKTITGRNGYQNDGKDPGFKALNAAGLSSVSAMPGLEPGSSQTLVRGSEVSHYLQKRTVLVVSDDKLSVQGHQDVLIMEDATFLCKADFLHGISGNESIRVNQMRNIIVLGTSEENYVGTHEVTAPEEFEWKTFERGFSATKLDLMGFGLDVHAVEVEAYGANVEAGVDSAEGAAFHQELKLSHAEESPIMTREGIEVDLLLRVDGLPDIGVGTPFR